MVPYGYDHQQQQLPYVQGQLPYGQQQQLPYGQGQPPYDQQQQMPYTQQQQSSAGPQPGLGDAYPGFPPAQQAPGGGARPAVSAWIEVTRVFGWQEKVHSKSEVAEAMLKAKEVGRQGAGKAGLMASFMYRCAQEASSMHRCVSESGELHGPLVLTPASFSERTAGRSNTAHHHATRRVAIKLLPQGQHSCPPPHPTRRLEAGVQMQRQVLPRASAQGRWARMLLRPSSPQSQGHTW